MESYINPDDVDQEIDVGQGKEEFDDDESEADDELSGAEDDDADYETVDDEDNEDGPSSVVLKGHAEAVLSVAVSANGDLIVTGGQDDKAIIWSAGTAKVQTVCSGHKDSVTNVSISNKEKHIATGDMSGLIQVWKRDIDSGNNEKIFEFEVDDLQWLSWHPILDNVLAAGDQSGTIYIIKVSDGTVKSLQGFTAPSTIGKFLQCGSKLLSGYDDGSIRLWDLKESNCIHTIKGGWAHKSSVTCLDIDPSDALSATGSTDSSVKLVNLVSGKVVATLSCGNPQELDKSKPDPRNDLNEEESVESVSFCSTLPLLAVGTLRGNVEIWDVPSQSKRITIKQLEGISKVIWSSQNPIIIYAAGLDGSIGSWDGRDGKVIFKKTVHEDQILAFEIGSKCDLLVTASEDGTCCITDCTSPPRT